MNSAGLRAPEPGTQDQGALYDTLPTAYFAKGSYFRLERCIAVLATDLPGAGARRSGGAHHGRSQLARRGSAPTSSGSTRSATPSTLARDGFYAAVRRYWPGLKDGALHPDFSGIRPKIVPPGAPAQDFTFHGPRRITSRA